MGKTEAAREIVSAASNRLCLDMRYLAGALMGLGIEIVDGSGLPQCDGRRIVLHEESIVEDYKTDPDIVARRLAHCVMHCILGHNGTSDDIRLAEDMIVEYVLDSIDAPGITTPGKDDRMYACEKIIGRAGAPIASLMAPVISDLSKWQRPLYERMFVLDDNAAHPTSDDGSWNETAQQVMTELEGFINRTGGSSDAALRVLKIRNARRQDHRAFLRRFLARRTTVKEDPLQYDPVFYSYGLRLYGNIPLIDSVEVSDTPHIEEMIVAIDTSGSTMRGPIQSFLEETFSILRQTGLDRTSRVHVIQCDDRVRSDCVIRSEGDIRKLMAGFEIQGGGGTDFRPVFTYVDHLVADGELKRPRCILYFTDGMGTFPERRPRYDTAFVFCDDRCRDHAVPPWAMKLEIRTTDLDRKAET